MASEAEAAEGAAANGFDSFTLPSALRAALVTRGYSAPTDVQKAVLDPALSAPGLGDLRSHLPGVAAQAIEREDEPLRRPHGPFGPQAATLAGFP